MDGERIDWRRRVWQVAPWAITAVIIAVLLREYSLGAIAGQLAHGTWWPVAIVGTLAPVFAVFVMGFADWLVARAAVGQIDYLDMVAGKAATSLLMVVSFAASGGLYGVWLARKSGASIRAALGVMLYIGLSDLTSLSIFVSIGVWRGGDELPAEALHLLRVLAPTIAAGTAALACLGPICFPRLVRRYQLLAPWRAVSPGVFALGVVARMSVNLTFIVACWVAANGFGLPLPFAAVCTYLPIILLVGALPINVAGFGAVQAAWLVFDDWGPGEQVLAFQFLWQLAFTAGLLIRGLPFLRRAIRQISGHIAEPLAGPISGQVARPGDAGARESGI